MTKLKPILIDIREHEEFIKLPPLPEVLTLPMSDYKNWIKTLSKDNEYLIICNTYNRSTQMVLWMQIAGYKATVVKEGMVDVTGEEDCSACQLFKNKGIIL